jgi:hypothetical protein
MDEEEAFAIFEGAAGIGGPVGGMGSADRVVQPIDTSGPQPNDGGSMNQPSIGAQPSTSDYYTPTVAPAAPAAAPSTMDFSWLGTLVDASCGAFVGYVAAPPKKRALYAGSAAVACGLLGSLGLLGWGLWAVRDKG